MTDEMGGCECLYYGSSMYAIVSPLLCVLGISEKKNENSWLSSATPYVLYVFDKAINPGRVLL